MACSHIYRAVHHLDSNILEKHWCPTGFIMCDRCGDIQKLDWDDAHSICSKNGVKLDDCDT